jgi:AcrR family transcriptional regulator
VLGAERYRWWRVNVKATSAPLLVAARGLFAERGYAAVELADIAQRADVSTEQVQRLYPGGKEELFAAVVVSVSAETAQRVRMAARLGNGPWEALERGITAFLDASVSTEVRQILLRDGPAVLGGEVWRAIDSDYAVGLLEAALEDAIAAGELTPQPTRAAAYVVVGALEDAAMTIAAAEDPPSARAEMGRMVERLLAGLRAPMA